MPQDEMHTSKRDDLTEKDAMSRRMDSIGWALFLIWVGFSSLVDIGWGWGLLGVAAIILGEAVLRRNMNLKIEGFWVVVGILFLVGGVWELLHVSFPLAPVLIILCGLAVLWGVFSDKHLMKK